MKKGNKLNILFWIKFAFGTYIIVLALPLVMVILIWRTAIDIADKIDTFYSHA